MPTRRSGPPTPANSPAARTASSPSTRSHEPRPLEARIDNRGDRPMTDLALRIAGAPISWGVCEVPGWGWQYDPRTVLTQMREVGIAATEFGPDGFLPDDPAEKAKTLADLGLRAVGGFVPVVLHDPAYDPSTEVAKALEGFVAA